jgi:hypothetical protein
MQRKPINLFTYILSLSFWYQSLQPGGLIYLIIAIALLFHSFMSGDTITIDDRKTP